MKEEFSQWIQKKTFQRKYKDINPLDTLNKLLSLFLSLKPRNNKFILINSKK